MSARSRMSMSLLQFLRQAVHPPSSPQTPHYPITYVLGNPSADLDSIISAIIFSYFSTSFKPTIGRENEACRQYYTPIINLPDVSSAKELARLRPEFLTALQLSLNGNVGDETDENGLLRDSIMTTVMLKEKLLPIHDTNPDLERNLDVFMVDWNALPVLANGQRGIEGLPNTQVTTKGCIDHHVDEKFVPMDVPIRRIQTGVGSCTSLVVRELRAQGLWPDIPGSDASGTFGNEGRIQSNNSDNSLIHESQAAKLALAAILIDTTNMTASYKVSDIDRLAVSFLEDKIKQVPDSSWDRDEFYDKIVAAKNSSLDKLTMDEVLGRDYKDWIDQISITDSPIEHVKTGICSVVKPLSWLISKAGSERRDSPSATAFFECLQGFAKSRDLDVIAVMTAYTSETENEFRRQLLVSVLNPAYSKRLEAFDSAATDQLHLKKCSVVDVEDPDHPIMHPQFTRVWRQLDVSKSRKQVAPLLRDVMSSKR